MAKILPSELAKIELAWIGRCRELQAENNKLKDEIDELETKVESLRADLFLKTIMSNTPTLETLKRYSDENDRLIAENNRLTAKISQITQILYDGDDDDEVSDDFDSTDKLICDYKIGVDYADSRKSDTTNYVEVQMCRNCKHHSKELSNTTAPIIVCNKRYSTNRFRCQEWEREEQPSSVTTTNATGGLVTLTNR